MLSILSIWTRLDATAVHVLLIPPDDALGIIFLGFALRLSRLEDFRPWIRLVLRTSRLCLVVLGLSKLLGVLLAMNHQAPPAGSITAPAGFSLGLLFLLLGIYLNIRHNQYAKRARLYTRIVTLSYLGSCWIALLLFVGGISGIPAGFQIQLLPLITVTVISALLFLPQHRHVHQGGIPGPEEESALSQSLFPLAYSIPIVLAFLRYHAESRKLVHPELALLLHVVLSAGSTIALIAYSVARTRAAQHQVEANDAVATCMETQYQTVLSALSLPVWIFGAEGRLTFANQAAGKLSPPPATAPGQTPHPLEAPFAPEHQRAIFNAALFGRPLASLTIAPASSQQPVELKVECLQSIQTYRGTPGSIVLIARCAAPQPHSPEDSS